MVDTILLGFAFSAGSVSFLNPCGYAVMTSYLSHYFSRKEKKKGLLSGVFEGASSGFLAMVGFITVNVLLGLLITFFGRGLLAYVPGLITIMGGILIVIGLAVLLNKSFGIHLSFRKGFKLQNKLSFYEYGIMYSLASFGCTLPIFLSIAIASISVSGFFEGSVVILSYALGMGVMMIGVTVIAATSKEFALKYLTKFMPHMSKINAVILVGVGLWLIYRNVFGVPL